MILLTQAITNLVKGKDGISGRGSGLASYHGYQAEQLIPKKGASEK